MRSARDTSCKQRRIEGLVVRAGVEIVPGVGMKRGAYLVVGGMVLLFVPDWARGADQREAIIAGQAVLLALDVLGADRALGMFAGALGLLRAERPT